METVHEPLVRRTPVSNGLKKPMEASASLSDRLSVQFRCNLLGDYRGIDMISQQMLKVKFWVWYFVRLRRIDIARRSFQILSETSNISEVPGFEMPLRICKL